VNEKEIKQRPAENLQNTHELHADAQV